MYSEAAIVKSYAPIPENLIYTLSLVTTSFHKEYDTLCLGDCDSQAYPLLLKGKRVNSSWAIYFKMLVSYFIHFKIFASSSALLPQNFMNYEICYNTRQFYDVMLAKGVKILQNYSLRCYYRKMIRSKIRV